MRLASVMKDVLIAYRGEVAVRVIWACRELGLRAVAVYSEADRTAPHVFLADESYLIGSASSADSCVQIDRILAVAVKSVKDVIHPGYGFLPSVWLLQRPWRRRIFPRTQLLRSFLSLSAERLSPRLGSRGLRIQMVSPPVGLLYPRSGTARDS